MPRLLTIAALALLAGCSSTKRYALPTIPPPPPSVSEGCPELPALGKRNVVEWAVDTVALYADCRERVRLAAEAWPKP